MSVWTDTALLGIYTLSPTHCGTGQATGAIDLPVARDASTGFPVLPATGIKGVARDSLSAPIGPLDKKIVDELFGPEITSDDTRGALIAGKLAFTEARLVAYPARSFGRPFLHVTCPLILERLARDLRYVGRGDDFLPENWHTPGATDVRALVSDPAWVDRGLVLEGLVYGPDDVGVHPQLKEFGGRLAELLPSEEEESRERLRSGLVVIPDADFRALMDRAVPVQARIHLTKGKTTGRWRDPNTGLDDNSGNLWYEEHLPSECLFLALVGERRSRVVQKGGEHESGGHGLHTLKDNANALRTIQIGGNETVGQGLCLCTVWPPAKEDFSQEVAG
mgnify:CR=1 FL=1